MNRRILAALAVSIALVVMPTACRRRLPAASVGETAHVENQPGVYTVTVTGHWKLEDEVLLGQFHQRASIICASKAMKHYTWEGLAISPARHRTRTAAGTIRCTPAE